MDLGRSQAEPVDQYWHLVTTEDGNADTSPQEVRPTLCCALIFEQ